MTTPPTKLLLVEDEPVIRDGITEALAIYGMPVTAVASGLEFYQALARDTFGVALIDLGLPDLEGYDLVSYLRQNTSLKIIIMSARNELADRVKGYQAGADLYLVKPVKIEELAAAIVSITSRVTESSPPAPDTWRLERATCRLLAPGGSPFQVSQKEALILRRLAGMKEAPLDRASLLVALYDKTGDSASSALDVLIYRLRTRFREETGIQLPLITITGVGFTFDAPLAVI